MGVKKDETLRQTQSSARVATGEKDEFHHPIVTYPNELPRLLAGPIVRYTSKDIVTIWLATSARVDVELSVYKDAGAEPPSETQLLDQRTASSIRIGRFLHITVVSAAVAEYESLANRYGGTSLGQLFVMAPKDDSKPHIVGYNLKFKFYAPVPGKKHKNDVEALPEQDLQQLRVREQLVCPGFYLPTFVVPGSAPNQGILVLHGSCRKLHGEGKDGIWAATKLLDDNAKDPGRRPQALFLTGDQIYADDVAKELAPSIRALGESLMGWDEEMPNAETKVDPPDKYYASKLIDERAKLVGRAGFTVEESLARNHLLAFGEFAAMYLLAWGPDLWEKPKKIEPTGESLKNAKIDAKEVRRLLANVSTYMILDDHEITDDWNIDSDVHASNEKSASARRMSANALAAYWIFQEIGNRPTLDTEATSIFRNYFENKSGKNRDDRIISDYLKNYNWQFTAPTNPPALFIDTRTKRKLYPKFKASNIGPALLADLMDAEDGPPKDPAKVGIQLQSALRRSAQAKPGWPLLIISPAPVIGHSFVELIQELAIANPSAAKYLGKVTDEKKNPYFWDPESWSMNPAAWVRLMMALLGSGQRRFIFLSGDVHYGFSASASFEMDGAKTSFIQLTSSAIKNKHDAASVMKNANFKFVHGKEYALVGFDNPPTIKNEPISIGGVFRDFIPGSAEEAAAAYMAIDECTKGRWPYLLNEKYSTSVNEKHRYKIRWSYAPAYKNGEYKKKFLTIDNAIYIVESNHFGLLMLTSKDKVTHSFYTADNPSNPLKSYIDWK